MYFRFYCIHHEWVQKSNGQDSVSSSSTLSDSGIKRRKTIYYFQGEGLKDWKPQTKDFDITSFLQKYRKKNMKIARSNSDLSNMKILSLSYIFPVDKYSEDTSITKYFKENVNNHIFNQLYSNIIIEKASTEAVIYCKSTSDRGEVDFQSVGVLDRKVRACCELSKSGPLP